MQSFISLKFVNKQRKQWNGHYLYFILERSEVQISVSLRFFLVLHKSCKRKYGSRSYRSKPFPIYYLTLFKLFIRLTIMSRPKCPTAVSHLFLLICQCSVVVVVGFVVIVIQSFVWFNLEGLLFLKIWALSQSDWSLLLHNVMQTPYLLYLVTYLPTVVTHSNHLKT